MALRTTANLAPPDIVADYHGHRAGPGFIITDPIAVAPYGAANPPIPGIFAAGPDRLHFSGLPVRR